MNANRSPIRRIAIAALPLVLLSAAACQGSATASAGSTADAASVRTALQGWFDTHPQCAPVLQTDAATDDLVAQPDDPAARALVAGGVIEPAGPGVVTVGGEQVVRYRPAERSKASFAKGKWGTSDAWLLCYAKRKVDAVAIKKTGAGARAEYRFTLVEAPAWMRDPAIVAGFPKVAATLSGRYAGEEPVPVEGGKPDLASIQPTFEHSLVTSGAAFLTQ
jgi:hypothetical protein